MKIQVLRKLLRFRKKDSKPAIQSVGWVSDMTTFNYKCVGSSGRSVEFDLGYTISPDNKGGNAVLISVDLREGMFDGFHEFMGSHDIIDDFKERFIRTIVSYMWGDDEERGVCPSAKLLRIAGLYDEDVSVYLGLTKTEPYEGPDFENIGA